MGRCGWLLCTLGWRQLNRLAHASGMLGDGRLVKARPASTPEAMRRTFVVARSSFDTVQWQRANLDCPIHNRVGAPFEARLT